MRASPSAHSATRRSTSSLTTVYASLPPLSRTALATRYGSVASARRSTVTRSAVVRPFSAITRHRDSNAYPSRVPPDPTELMEKDGFSVVAPIRTSSPLSMKGRKMSCCFLLNRWISSMNNTVGFPVWRNSLFAFSATARISWMPAVQQESEREAQEVCRMMMEAMVVLPQPGGPKRISEGGGSCSRSVRRTVPAPKRSVFP